MTDAHNRMALAAQLFANSNAVGDVTLLPTEDRDASASLAAPDARGKTEIRVARDFAEVETLREAWSKWPGHRDSEIDFYLMILRSYPEVLRPHVIALYRDGQPEAILIGRLEEKKLAFRVGYLTLFRPEARCLDFVYGGLRGNASPENTELLFREAMKCLGNGEADLAVLEFVPIGSDLYRFSQTLPGSLGRDTSPAETGHESLKLPADIEELYKRMSSKRRSEIRRKAKRFVAQAAEGIKIVCYREPEQLDRIFHDVEEIAKKTYLRGLGTGFEDNALVRARLELCARKGWLRAYVLYIGDRPCTYWIGMLCGETFYGEYVGYDPEYRLLSPGMYVMLNVIETFCNGTSGDVVTEVDFGFGNAEYKSALCNSSSVEASVFVFAPTFKGLRLNLLRSATRIADQVARKAFGRANWLQKIKKTWRGSLAKRAANGLPEAEAAQEGKPISAPE
ncbi:MAG TPA: GNAT family N-acetyltransferase [Candidatus Acidoferrales bacterium]|nr:GNAT family N-acetyltransferase [Candidatus Acidoferrales bacterium]